MGKNLLFVNVSKNSRIIVLHSAEAEKYGHTVFNLTDFPRDEYSVLRHIEYCKPDLEAYRAKIREMVKEHSIDFVTSHCEILSPLLDELEGVNVLPKMGVPIDTIVNKEKFGIFCKENGIEHPDFLVPTELDEIEHTFDRAIFVKPTNGTHGSTKLFMTDDRYADIDYLRYKNPKEFLGTLDRLKLTNEFLDTQRNGKDMKVGKSIAGIRGRHVIQECVAAKWKAIINILVADNEIKFLIVMKTENRFDTNIYPLYEPSTSEFEIMSRDLKTNHQQAKDILGDAAFESFMDQMQTIVDRSKMELAVLNVCLVPFRKDSFFIQDIQPRHGGNTAKIIKMDEITEADKQDLMPHVLFKDLDYTSIWEYV